jgi:hypothetical protein
MELQVDAAQRLDRAEALAQAGDVEDRAHALTGPGRQISPAASRAIPSHISFLPAHLVCSLYRKTNDNDGQIVFYGLRDISFRTGIDPHEDRHGVQARL